MAQTASQNKDLNTVEKITEAYFTRISGDAGQADWDDFGSLFLPTIQLNAIGINNKGENIFYPQDLNAFTQHMQEYTRKSGFFQYCSDRVLTRYARIAQVLCIYESRTSPSGEVIDRGLMSFHLLRHGGRWWIAGGTIEQRNHTAPYPGFPRLAGARSGGQVIKIVLAREDK